MPRRWSVQMASAPMTSLPKRVLDVFVAHDPTGDGVMSEDDLRQALIAVGLSSKEIDGCLEYAEAHMSDGTIEYNEFLAWIFDDGTDVLEAPVPASAKPQADRSDSPALSDG
eukprot:gnl/MRDRNA2_/MRDRNA2_150155_c0_seq1.p1 gnl/MRDRNA2_/MRDRNA2_150155_c0~~gnl/MRDRNA2_/MRDRNA2_150155_c0_seq1.p1  ORF type:complete len:112 (-),score=15.54 gnl/MRDRNA2_/MRDRNA2_150155_c0_seq1:156-491(-)